MEGNIQNVGSERNRMKEVGFWFGLNQFFLQGKCGCVGRNGQRLMDGIMNVLD